LAGGPALTVSQTVLVSQARPAHHLTVRIGSGFLFVSLSVAASALTVVVAAATASAAKGPTVAFKLTVAGAGVLRVTGSPAFTCHPASFGASCKHTFRVRKGRRVAVTARPLPGWKLTTWAGACKGASPRCSLRLKAKKSAMVTFVPPGDRLNPFRFGSTQTVTGFGTTQTWLLKVNTATLNADAQVEAVIDPQTGRPANGPPPAGAQYTLLNLSLTYTGGGSASVESFIFDGGIVTEGAHNAEYRAECIPPWPDLNDLPNDQVFSNQAVTGNLCFTIASNDAGTLLLKSETTSGSVEHDVWFALS
jgi:hypothetical protein